MTSARSKTRRTAWQTLPAAALIAMLSGSAQAADDDDPYYQGCYTGYMSFLQQANLSIGVMSDAAVKGVYAKDTALGVIGLHGKMAAAVEKELTTIAAEADDEDAAQLKRMALVAGLLRKQATTLLALLGGDQEQAKAFGEARAETAKVMDALEKELEEFLEK